MEINHFYKSHATVVGLIGLYTFFISSIFIFNQGKKEGDKCMKWLMVSLQVLFLCAIYGMTAVIITNANVNIPSYLFNISDIVGYIALLSGISAFISFVSNIAKAELERKGFSF